MLDKIQFCYPGEAKLDVQGKQITVKVEKEDLGKWLFILVPASDSPRGRKKR